MRGHFRDINNWISHTSQVMWHSSKQNSDSFSLRGWDQGRVGGPMEIESVVSCIITKKLVLSEKLHPFPPPLEYKDLEYNGTHLSWKTIWWPSVVIQEWSVGFSLTSTLTLHDLSISSLQLHPIFCSRWDLVSTLLSILLHSRGCVHFLLALV